MDHRCMRRFRLTYKRSQKPGQNILDEYTPQGEETGKGKISWIEQANRERIQEL